MALSDILFWVFLMTGIIVIAIIVIVCLNKDKKKQIERKERCTIRTTGTLLRVNQTSSMVSTDDYDNYYYYPVIRYEYNGQIYETEYDSKNGLFSSKLWNQVGVNSPLDVFINPADENEIYVPLPETVNEKNNNKNKFLIVFFIIWILAGFLGAFFSELFKTGRL